VDVRSQAQVATGRANILYSPDGGTGFHRREYWLSDNIPAEFYGKAARLLLATTL
jgi:hypothetical protein